MDNLKEDKEKKERRNYYETSNKLECAVCLQTCIQPVQLPCRHIFCYLCVKGVTNQSKRCAMCRQEIPVDYLDNPFLIPTDDLDVPHEGGYQWFYEGRNGWWQYDERTSSEIETSYNRGDKQCEVLIAGFLYVIDFQKCIQVRRCDPFRRRRIKRDLSSIPKKGVAGIRAVAIHNSSDEVSVLQDENDTLLDTSKMAVQFPCGWSERDISSETQDSAISVNCDTESYSHSVSEPLSSFSGINVSDSEKSASGEKPDTFSDTSHSTEYAEASFSEENDNIFKQ